MQSVEINYWICMELDGVINLAGVSCIEYPDFLSNSIFSVCSIFLKKTLMILYTQVILIVYKILPGSAAEKTGGEMGLPREA
jgi:hypothetical protein